MKTNRCRIIGAEHPVGTLLASPGDHGNARNTKGNGAFGLLLRFTDQRVPKEKVPWQPSVLDETLSNPSGTCVSNGFSSRFWASRFLAKVARVWLQQVQRRPGIVVSLVFIYHLAAGGVNSCFRVAGKFYLC
ncbi:hypothetical protein TNIN_424141 [Trichonephila inaurata madagascariensis]|uniref:Uncharacterized protein n=1 Tax=Trichonephila inaurata madagascariensis TaxID=2747483 RepID=A0A8X6YBW0_9ARAC|nr:hypothetical protein TNIN_424141 [Trichonephila inaurata madagascariensis]